MDTDQEKSLNVGAVSSAIAAFMIKRHLASGGKIYIPSLDITIPGNKPDPMAMPEQVTPEHDPRPWARLN